MGPLSKPHIPLSATYRSVDQRQAEAVRPPAQLHGEDFLSVLLLLLLAWISACWTQETGRRHSKFLVSLVSNTWHLLSAFLHFQQPSAQLAMATFEMNE